MEVLLAIVVGVLYGAGMYLVLRRSIVKLILGLTLISQAANVLIFTVGRLTREAPPLIGANEDVLTQPYADPLPQALILTAIVISFGVTAFAIVLVRKAYQIVDTGDFDEMSKADNPL